MDAKEYAFDRCLFCDRRKYRRITGFFPAPVPTDLPIFKSIQYFGSGANRAVLVSGSLYQSIMHAALKGAEFSSCA